MDLDFHWANDVPEECCAHIEEFNFDSSLTYVKYHIVSGFIVSNPVLLKPSNQIRNGLLLIAYSRSSVSAGATASFKIAVDLVVAQELPYAICPSKTSRSLD